METELKTEVRPLLHIGIDVGFVNLAICLIYSNGVKDDIEILTPELLSNGEMDLKAISKFLPDREAEVILEDVHSFPKQGVASTFKFGFSKGVIIGLCVEKGYKINLVSPQWWKNELNLIGKSKKESVLLAKGMAEEKFHPLLKNHNSAEAFLMAKLLKNGKTIYYRGLKVI